MICLSFDTDHVDEARMGEFLEEVPVPGAGTFFCTQIYRALVDSPHELCPHPFLGEGADWNAELDRKRREFPLATGWRSHSCIFSHLLAERVAGAGYRYVSTHDDFGKPGLLPHKHCWGVWQMPIFYMDNLDFSRQRFWSEDGHRPFSPALIERAVHDDGIYVFDFHPIHLLLNTDSVSWYFAHRDAFKGGTDLASLRSKAYGVRSFYDELCEAMEASGTRSARMDEALEGFERAERTL